MSAQAYAPLWKRLTASLYDLLPLLALLMLGTALMLPLTGAETAPPVASGRIPFNSIQGIPRSGFAHYAHQAFMLLLIAFYYVWSWYRGGHTIGMRAWRLRVRMADGGALDLRTAALRFAASLLSVAVFGLGLIWALFDPQRRMWHDRIAGTVVVVVPKP